MVLKGLAARLELLEVIKATLNHMKCSVIDIFALVISSLLDSLMVLHLADTSVTLTHTAYAYVFDKWTALKSFS